MLVLVIIGVVVAMHLVSFVNYLLMPNPLEMAKQQSEQAFQSLGKDQQKLQQDLNKAIGSQQMQQAVRLGKWIGLVWLVGSFSLSLILLLFLYLRHDWARMVLGILCVLAGCLGLLGLVFGGLTALRVLSGGAAIMAILEMVARLGVNFGIGARHALERLLGQCCTRAQREVILHDSDTRTGRHCASGRSGAGDGVYSSFPRSRSSRR